ncbi:hypothetical protein EC957_001261 [Mortierella hygrophila]|uniref:N-acetyltransferase domain-containing protein n=1 Tax=Mortierella hygrophila TaxID=979708 RepID=A0A9P6F635_9FUNG|nr:hypothetical protein EC957_001261 [Mortierella hygrophila]
MAPSFIAINPKLVDGTPFNPLTVTTTSDQQSPIVIWRLVLPSFPSLSLSDQTAAPLESEQLTTALDQLYPQLSTRCSAGPSLDRLNTCLANHETFSLYLATEVSISSTRLPEPRVRITRILGALTLVTLNLLMKSCAHIEDVVVDDRCRGRGLGKGLMRRALDEAVNTHNCVMVDLTSNPNRIEARTLYQSLGFELRDTGVFRYTVPQYRK